MCKILIHSRYDLYPLRNGNCLALALKFDSKSIIKDIIEKFKREVIGLNLRVEGDMLVEKTDHVVPVHELPPSPKFESILQMTEATAKFLPDISKELATLSSNDDTVIININHAVCDGKYIVGIVEHLFDKPKNPNDHYFPITLEEEFSEEIKERNKKPNFFQVFYYIFNNTFTINLVGENMYGIMACFSILGPIFVKKPLVDLYLYNMIYTEMVSYAIPFLNYSIIDERNNRNELHSQPRYENNGLSKKQAIILSKSLEHYLQNFDTNNTISETLNDLKKIPRLFLVKINFELIDINILKSSSNLI